ncbi:MAG: glycosyltransferase family 4 protein [Chthonomonadales bacterium]|nr:glycosyltransferase family 4 protein [Chthonomonadales bacterium]
MRSTPWFASNSRHGAGFLANTLGAPLESIRVIHNGVEIPNSIPQRTIWRSDNGLTDNMWLACMAANLHAFKDHPTLLRAWRIVLDRARCAPDRLLLILPGLDAGLGTALKALAFELDLGRSVRFLGWSDNVPSVLAASDCCVFSSRWEGVPNGVLEGMAAGLPVVGTDIPGIREAVGDEGCAILTPPDDAEAMARAILAVMEDPGMGRHMGEIGRERIRTEFAPEKMVRETTEWIEEGLERVGR